MNNAPPAILTSSDPCSPHSVSSSKTALLLLDFHGFIAAGQPNGPSAIAAASALRLWAKEQGIVIIHCLIDLRATTKTNRKMAPRANTVRDKMQFGRAEISVPVLMPEAGDFTFWRPPSCVSALGSYGLKSFLEQHSIESLILTGFSTSGCVINTAKSAADDGFIVTVVDDACGDKSQDVHDIVMAKLLIGQAHVVKHEEWIDVWPDHNEDTNGLESVVAGTGSLKVGGSP